MFRAKWCISRVSFSVARVPGIFYYPPYGGYSSVILSGLNANARLILKRLKVALLRCDRKGECFAPNGASPDLVFLWREFP
jgi:hypothetical protein